MSTASATQADPGDLPRDDTRSGTPPGADRPGPHTSPEMPLPPGAAPAGAPEGPGHPAGGGRAGGGASEPGPEMPAPPLSAPSEGPEAPRPPAGGEGLGEGGLGGADQCTVEFGPQQAPEQPRSLHDIPFWGS
jgi:hypothetical protein